MKVIKVIPIIVVTLLSVSKINGQSLNPTSAISAPGSVNNFTGGYTFSYATSGSPWNGALISFGGFSNNYDCQISTDYGPHGGNHISFRTRNGDGVGWNTWNEIWHSGNLNKDDIDFNCKNLYANGNLWAKEIKVALTNPWADFVFKPGYKLISLDELEQFIKQKGHLPEMPTADEIQTNGINIGAIQTKLLQKIEEQTLYIIELDKQLQELKKQMEELKK